MTPFLVRVASGDQGPVELWSRSRLPFEPKGEDLEMRGELRRALHTLQGGPGKGLRATLYSPPPPRGQVLDAENVLFYNVGTSAFVNAGTNGLAWEWRQGPFIHSERRDWIHHHRYEVAPINQPWSHFFASRSLLRWNAVECSTLSSDTKPAKLWLEFVESTHWTVVDSVQPGRPLGLRLTLEGPVENLPGIVKPLVDGVVAALYQHDGSDLSRIIPVLCAQTSATSARVEQALMNASKSVLGRRRLLWPRANGVQWNPGDDACIAVAIQRQPAKDGCLRISGELVELSEAPGS